MPDNRKGEQLQLPRLTSIIQVTAPEDPAEGSGGLIGRYEDVKFRLNVSQTASDETEAG